MVKNKGTVIQVMGPVLDIRFGDDQLPSLLSAIETVLTDGRVLTPDLGGTATTAEVGDAVAALL